MEVESEQRLKLIYAILSSDLVEDMGDTDAASDDPVLLFSRRIGEMVGMAPDFVARYVRLWIFKGYLRYLRDQGASGGSGAGSAAVQLTRGPGHFCVFNDAMPVDDFPSLCL
ncbi:MAG: hypothetical protein R2874_12490 [Desulfobacterales bacterium]